MSIDLNISSEHQEADDIVAKLSQWSSHDDHNGGHWDLFRRCPASRLRDT